MSSSSWSDLIAAGSSPDLGDRTDTERSNPLRPIHIPAAWNGSALLTIEEFCSMARTPQGTVRAWQSRGTGPRFWRFNGTGRLYTTVDEVRRWIAPSIAAMDVRDGEPGDRQ